MSRWLGGAVVLGCLGCGVAVLGGDPPPAAGGAKPPAEAKKADPPADVDIVKDVRDWNSEKFATPPTEFRQGHVTPRQLDKGALKKRDGGFVVQLPSNAPVPTPTVYKGKVYVSGGFHSKQFFCLDAKTGELAWGLDLDDDGPTAAVCDDGVTVFNTESCTLFAVESATGKLLWSHWLGDPLTSTPTIADGKVFTTYPAAGRGGPAPNPAANPAANAAQPPGKAAPAPAGQRPPCSHVLCALDLKTGKILWQRWIDSDVMSAPVAVDGELYAASFAGVVYKFAQKDGAVLSAVKTRATSAPVVVGKDVYYTRRTDDAKAAEPAEALGRAERATGKVVASGESKKADYLDPKVQQNAEFKAQAQKLDAANGFAGGAPAAANPQAAFANVGQGNVSSMQAFQGSRVLHLSGQNVNTMGDEVVASDPATGKERWRVKLEGDLKKEGGFLAAPPAAAGGHLILTTLKGEVLRMDPKDGKVVKRWPAGGPVRFQPAVDGERIYVGTQDGKLVCVDTKDETLTGWPCWGGNPAHTGAVPATK